MLDYILKMKTIYDNLAAVGEPVKDRDHILQLLGGLGPDYNSIVAFLTAREDDLSLHSVHSILLTHEQKLHLQHSSLQIFLLPLPIWLLFHPDNHPDLINPVIIIIRQDLSTKSHLLLTDLQQDSTLSNQETITQYPLLITNHIIYLHVLNANCVASSVIRLSNAITVLTSTIKATMVFHLHRLLFLMPCLLPHQIIGATRHLSHSAQISLVFSHIQVLIKSQLVMAIRYPFFTQVTKKILLKGWLRDGLYEFSSSSPPRAFVTPSSFSDGAIWHSRLGHPASLILSKALASCNPSPLFTDLWGPAPSISITGARYFLIFIDDYSRHTWIYFLSTKDQALHSFITFRKMVENQLHTTIKCIQSDNGGEFLVFKPYLEAHGILHQFSYPHTPQQNGRAERKIRHLVETGLALMAQSFLPSKYWTYAFQTAVYLINLLPAKLLHFQSPIQAFFHKLPNYHHLRVFGCLCFPSLRPYTQHKLCYRSTACVFLGYAPAHKGYLCLDVSTSRIYISKNVIFHESSFPFQSSSPPPSPPPHLPSSTPALINSPSLSAPSSLTVSSPIITSDSIPPLIPVPFTTSSPAAPSPPPLPLKTHPIVTRAKSSIHKKRSFIVQHTTEPRTYSQASKTDSWVQAMNREYQALLRNNTWSLVPPPSSAHIVGCRWIYKLKYRPDGSIDRHKARLVAQFPFNARFVNWMWRMLSLMEILKKRAWFQKLRIALLDYGFQSSRADTSLFIFHTASDILILLVYVDDILVTGSSPTLVSHFISYLSAKFALRDLGPLSYFLGIQAHQLGSVLHLT
ncbi:Retrovirus-related Pol polyprotein from transposon RE1 [Vitis vinifera]|uniref:Retrovirus-related Pol polyprotein from transposon RE1 n=1 Tax=Vitis vinifera TaxID=29760 RepID=A0A438CHC7_VITVI|nr:Retrovirus-related Pol polyprotein from transposon RE1 [Vitis vinifera]